jgi:hypothetical protein
MLPQRRPLGLPRLGRFRQSIDGTQRVEPLEQGVEKPLSGIIGHRALLKSPLGTVWAKR